MRFRALAPDLWMASSRGVNVYLVSHDDELTLIDSGTPDMAAPILQALKTQPELAVRPLASIVLTHAHYDHAGGAATIAEQTGADVWIHPKDAALVTQGQWRREAEASPTIHGQLLTKLIANRYPSTIPAISLVRSIEDKIAGGGGMTAYPMPGHSAGQVALLWSSEDGSSALFAGDVFMNLLGPREPILYEDRHDGLRSIGQLAEVASNADTVLVGHGPPMKVTSRLVKQLSKIGQTAR